MYFNQHLGLAPEKVRCLIPDCNENPENATFSDWPLSIYYEDDKGESTDGIDFCRRYPLNSNHSSTSICTAMDFNRSVTNKMSLIECIPRESGIVFDSFAMDSTAVTEFGLVCKDEYKVWILNVKFFSLGAKFK